MTDEAAQEHQEQADGQDRVAIEAQHCQVERNSQNESRRQKNASKAVGANRLSQRVDTASANVSAAALHDPCRLTVTSDAETAVSLLPDDELDDRYRKDAEKDRPKYAVGEETQNKRDGQKLISKRRTTNNSGI